MPQAIYDPARHEPLTAARWHEARVRECVAAIVADAEDSMRDGVWPNHPRDDDEEPPLLEGMTTVYLGAAGMLWALHALGSTRELAQHADEAVRRYRERPDSGEHAPGLLAGEAGILLVALLLGGSADHRERLRQLVAQNERNPIWEVMWGSPGTMLAARAAGLDAEYERAAAVLVEEWDAMEDGFWTQPLSRSGRPVKYVGPVHGFAGNVHALRGYLQADELRRRIEKPLRAVMVRDDGGVNWLPVVDSEPDRVQWCHGAPGIVITIGDLLRREHMLGGAELTWHAGPLANGAGLCHGTAGNGYALLRAHELTGDEEWLDRARRFAVHALEQVGRARKQYGRGWFSLFTGDVGAALFAQACLDVDARFPVMERW